MSIPSSSSKDMVPEVVIGFSIVILLRMSPNLSFNVPLKIGPEN